MTNLKGLKVRNIMTKDVYHVEVPGNRLEALNLMKKRDISGLPVVKKGTHEFLGIITRHDIYDKPDKEQLAMLYKEDGATVTPGSSVDTLLKRFNESRQYWIPVIENDHLKGIVTPTDLLRYVEERGKGLPVLDFMERHSTVPVHRKTPLSIILHLLRITRIPALPVLDDVARVIGIVSDLDVFRILISEEGTSREMRLDVEDDDWTWEGIRNFNQIYALPDVKLPDLKVEDVMVKDVRYIYPHSDVAGAAKTMRVNNIGQLPICDSNDILVGMLYNYDLISVLFPKS